MRKTTPPLTAAIYGALLALVIAYALSYVATRYGLGPLGLPDGTPMRGPAVFARSGVNLCAMHCVPLRTGEVRDVATSMPISVHVTLPLTVWSIIPALALLIGGYASAKSREQKGRWGTALPALLGGVVYAGLLAAFSHWFSAHITSSALPSIEGAEFNPPGVSFQVNPLRVFWFAGGFGLLFSYMGALLALRGRREYGPGKWWVCAKSTIGVAIVVQLIIAASAGTWFQYKGVGRNSAAPGKVYEMLPAVSGVVYGAMYGAKVEAAASGAGAAAESASAAFQFRASLYRGVEQQGRVSRFSKGIYVMLIIPAAAIFLAGFLAVRWGSRDGSVPTALRILVLQVAWLAALMRVCRVGWGMETGSGPLRNNFELFAGLVYDPLMIYCGIITLFLALVGAQIAGTRSRGWDGL